MKCLLCSGTVMKTKSICIYLLILTPISVTLRGVSVGWCRGRAAGVLPQQPGRPGFTTLPSWLRFAPSRATPRDFSYPLISSLFPSTNFGKNCHWISMCPCVWASLACWNNIPFIVPIDSAPSLLPLSLSLMAACLSPCQQTQPLHLSINVLSFHFLFLSVYLSVWHVSSCLGAPGLLSAMCWFLFFCQFTCLSETLRLDMSTYLLVFLFSRRALLKVNKQEMCCFHCWVN